MHLNEHTMILSQIYTNHKNIINYQEIYIVQENQCRIRRTFIPNRIICTHTQHKQKIVYKPVNHMQRPFIHLRKKERKTLRP